MDKKHYNRRKVVMIMSVLLVIGAFFLTKWVIHNLLYVSTDDAQVKANVVGVGSKASARAIFLGAEEGDKVSKGQILARLDTKELSALLAQATSAAEAARLEEERFAEELGLQKREAGLKIDMAGYLLSSSQNKLDTSLQDMEMQEETVRADINRQEAAFMQAKAAYAEASRDNTRSAELYEKGAISKQAQERALTAYITGKEFLEQQEQLLNGAKAHLRTIQMKKNQYLMSKNELNNSNSNLELANISAKRVELDKEKLKYLSSKHKEAEAKVDYYQTMLKETEVISPVDGQVARRNIRIGEVTAPGVPVFYIVDSTQLWINANIEEDKIRRVNPGVKVNVKVDAYPNRVFEGVVEFIGPAASSEFSMFPSDNASGNFIKVTHRIPVRIKVENPDKLLKPGMNVVVDIRVGKK